MVLESFVIWAQNLIVQFSYIAVFFVSLVSTSTIFLPFPIYVIIFFAAGLGLNPLLVGIASGIGSALGELTGYFVGAGGRVIIEEKKKMPKLIEFFTKFFKKRGFITVVLTSFLPFPFDIIGIIGGMSKYNIKNFLIATTIGKTAKTLLIAYAGFISVPYIEFLIRSMF